MWYLPVALGLHAHLWLLAAQPQGHPARVTQELTPVLVAYCSSQPCHAAPMPGDIPQTHHHPKCPTQSRLPCAIIQSGFSIPHGWLQ